MTTDTNGAGGLPRPSDAAIAKAFWELSDKAFQTPDDEWIFPVLRLISDRAGELCRATREVDGEVQRLLIQLADECEGLEGVGSEVIGRRIRNILRVRTLSRVAVQEGWVIDLLSAAKIGFDHIDNVSHGNDWCAVRSAIHEAETRIAAAQRQEGGSNG